MSVKSFSQERSSFTPYQNGLEQKQLSLFSRLNLNEKDQISFDNPLRNFNECESSDLFSMRSKKRKRSAQIQLKESLPGNKTYLNVSLVGKSSLHNNDIFGHHQHYQDLGLGEEYDDDEKKQFSQKSCPVGLSSYNFEDQFEQKRISRHLESEVKPRFHKTKNMLRTIGGYLHKYILNNKRCKLMQQKYFRKMVIRNLRKQERDEKIPLQIFEKIRLNEDSQHHSNEEKSSRHEKKKQRRRSLHKSASQQIIGTKEAEIEKAKKKEQQDLFEQKQLLIETETQQKITKFHQWIENLSVINFADYERVWSETHEFSPLYRQICYKYYTEDVVCDVMKSRLTTKEVILRYLHQFIQGLFNPKQFYRFK